MYAEDLDLCWRLAEAGWLTRYEPSAHVSHAVSASTEKAWGDERNRRSAVATYDWIRRRRGAAAAWTIAGVNVAGTGLRSILAGLRARLMSDPEAAAERERLLWHMRLHKIGLGPSKTSKS